MAAAARYARRSRSGTITPNPKGTMETAKTTNAHNPALVHGQSHAGQSPAPLASVKSPPKPVELIVECSPGVSAVLADIAAQVQRANDVDKSKQYRSTALRSAVLAAKQLPEAIKDDGESCVFSVLDK